MTSCCGAAGGHAEACRAPVHPELQEGDSFTYAGPHSRGDEVWTVTYRTDWYVVAHCPTRTGEGATSAFSGKHSVTLVQDALF